MTHISQSFDKLFGHHCDANPGGIIVMLIRIFVYLDMLDFKFKKKQKIADLLREARGIARAFARLVLKIQKFTCRCIVT